MSKKNKKPNKKSATTYKTHSNKNVKLTAEYTILRIDWEDHFSGNRTWQSVDEMRHDPMINVSVGVKVYEDKKVITLAQNIGENQLTADTTTIIKSCIVDKNELGKVRFGREQ